MNQANDSRKSRYLRGPHVSHSSSMSEMGRDLRLRVLLVALAGCALAAGCLQVASSGTGHLLGDANCDGSINSLDSALVLQYDAGLISSLPCQTAADVNLDGMVGSLDATLILQFTAGLLGSLSPPNEALTPEPTPTATTVVFLTPVPTSSATATILPTPDPALIWQSPQDDEGLAGSSVIVAFADGMTVRLSEKNLVSLGPHDVAELSIVFAQHPIVQISPLFSRSVDKLEEERRLLEEQTGEPQPDLTLFFRITLRPKANAQALVSALLGLDLVASAYIEPLPAPPPG